MNPLRQHIDDLLNNIRAVERFTVDGRDAFMSDDKTQYAVVRAYEIIGEVVKRMPAEILARYPEVTWKQIAGFRDFLIHRYDEIDLAIVWSAVEKLPALKVATEDMWRNLDTEEQ